MDQWIAPDSGWRGRGVAPFILCFPFLGATAPLHWVLLWVYELFLPPGLPGPDLKVWISSIIRDKTETNKQECLAFFLLSYTQAKATVCYCLLSSLLPHLSSAKSMWSNLWKHWSVPFGVFFQFLQFPFAVDHCRHSLPFWLLAHCFLHISLLLLWLLLLCFTGSYSILPQIPATLRFLFSATKFPSMITTILLSSTAQFTLSCKFTFLPRPFKSADTSHAT